MKSGWMNTVTSAIVGGVVGAMVAFACGAFSTPDMLESLEKLKVGELIVSEKMMLWPDGKEDADLLIQNGGILAKTRIIGTQICGNAMLANVMLTTPDNPMNQLDQCTIFTEIGSSPTEGGLLTVRSPNGGNTLGNPNGVTSGIAFSVAYDVNGNPACFFRNNATQEIAMGNFGDIMKALQRSQQQGQPSGQPQTPAENMPTQNVGQNVEQSAMLPQVTR